MNEHTPTPEGDDELGFALPRAAPVGRTRVIAFALIAVAVAAAAFFIGYLPRRQARRELSEASASAEQATRRVEVVGPVARATDRALLLPGTVQPLEETVVYPRAGGYVRRWVVDLGDKVTEGQLLAEIEIPEVLEETAQARAQLAQARAAVAQMKANQTLSQANLTRYQDLVKQKLVAAADLEQRQAQAAVDDANLAAAVAAVAAQDANLRRLAQLQAFARVQAPFAGTVVARTVERGALVDNKTPLFRIAAMDPVRVIVQVPQDVAPGVKAGLQAGVGIREYGDRVFPGQISRAAGALDPSSRTMSTEVRVANTDGNILPGMYAQVSMKLPTPHRVYEVPATSIYNDADGVRVATVDASGKIKHVPVVIERDTGKLIEIASGLRGDEKIVKIASAQLVDGVAVEAVSPTPATADGGAASKAP